MHSRVSATTDVYATILKIDRQGNWPLPTSSNPVYITKFATTAYTSPGDRSDASHPGATICRRRDAQLPVLSRASKT